MIRRLLAVLSLLAVAVFGWRRLPRDLQANMVGSARRIAASLAARVAFSLWRDTDVDSSSDLDLGSVGFDWRSHPSESVEFLSELEAAGVWAHEAGPMPDGHDAVVTEKLQDAGIHLDQEGSLNIPHPTPAARLVGTTSPQRLVNALSTVQSKGLAGLVVDTNGSVVEIDQHPSVGAGRIVLIDDAGAHLLRSGTNRALLQALQVASDRLHAASEPSDRREYVVRVPE